MKLNPLYGFLPILALGLFTSLPVIGQEEKATMEYENLRELRNDSISFESELKTINKPIISSGATRETETTPKATKPLAKPADKTPKPEDPLSFNFLYYIIEKFKMSDMIE
jgi:hypothetical protein